ncbi:hypothetical protein [Cryobacterium sp. Y82]|uniref:hypothetical protein n=1 Tax=Cryobacterium sp. Y82 TaxID=2045017 RepID=UPI000CE4E146|nr:hypothetical protein [Cryobacterium sp. Y82]
MDSHQRLGSTSGLVIVDRAYNGEKARNFQIPLLQKFAYKSKEHRKHFGMRSLVESANKTLKWRVARF